MATRGSAKAARVSVSPDSKAKGGKRGPKANLAASQFKARALPLHINVTNTPPSIADGESAPATSVDPGFIGTTTLLPSTFSTGSYGWKGSKRITIELPNPDGGDDSKEKVHVMLTINATVMGSKNAKEEPEGKGGEEVEVAEEEGAKGESLDEGNEAAVAEEAE